MGPLCPLPSCGPLWSVPLTLYLCKALCHSFLGWAGWAGVGREGLGPALSSLSLVGQEVLYPSPWLGGWETPGQHFWFGKYIYCFVLFF